MEKLNRAMTAMVVALAAVIGAGCASVGGGEPSATPTHRWVAQTDVSSAKYNFDNKLCAESSMVELRGTEVVAAPSQEHSQDAHGEALGVRKGAEFAAYQRCMQGKGYDLATY